MTDAESVYRKLSHHRRQYIDLQTEALNPSEIEDPVLARLLADVVVSIENVRTYLDCGHVDPVVRHEVATLNARRTA